MYWSLALVLAAAGGRSEPEATKLFTQIEAKLRAAKVIKVAMMIEVRRDKEVHKGKAVLLLGEGNRVRYESEGIGPGGGPSLFVCDGKSMAVSATRGLPGKIKAPATLRDELRVRLSRFAVTAVEPWMGSGKPGDDPEKFPVGDFMLKGTEKVGGRDARVLRYGWGLGGIAGGNVTLWVDAKTLLPLKRQLGGDGEREVLTEIYTEVALEPRLDAAAFDLQQVLGPQAEAEKLFRAMEKKVREAKTLKVVVAAEDKGDKEVRTFKGVLLLGGGKKARLELTSRRDGKEVKELLVSDGKEMIGVGGNLDTEGKTGPVPASFTPQLGQVTARLGLLWLFGPGRGDKDDEKFDIEKFARVENTRLGRKGKVGGREARAIEYQSEDRDRVYITLWLDTQTGLPLKRVIADVDGGKRYRTTEVYTEFTVNPQLDAALFVLPKK